MITIGALFCHFVHCQQSTAAAANESIDRGQVNKFVINPRRRDDSMQRVIEIGKPNSEKLPPAFAILFAWTDISAIITFDV